MAVETEPSPAPPRGRRTAAVVAVVVVVALVAGGLVALRLRGSSSPADDGPPPRLVWSDDFTGASLETTSWDALHLSTFGDGNEELACLTDRAQNLSVSDGSLVLTARREQPPLQCGSSDERFPGGREYSSAFISTEGLLTWKHPRVEVRAALPLAPGVSAGLWPAFWMRPEDKSPGELDILEGLGSGDTSPATLHQTIHYPQDGRTQQQTHEVDLPDGFDPTQFHTYAMDVRADRVDWSVDGTVTFSVGADQVPDLAATLDKPWFLRLNLAVGGSWPGNPTSATELPASMRVDWVKVYQR